jgi:hypothetical protein
MYKKKTIILKATDNLAVQMLQFIGSFYWLYKACFFFIHVCYTIFFLIYISYICIDVILIFFVFILKADQRGE